MGGDGGWKGSGGEVRSNLEGGLQILLIVFSAFILTILDLGSEISRNTCKSNFHPMIFSLNENTVNLHKADIPLERHPL